MNLWGSQSLGRREPGRSKPQKACDKYWDPVGIDDSGGHGKDIIPLEESFSTCSDFYRPEKQLAMSRDSFDCPILVGEGMDANKI